MFYSKIIQTNHTGIKTATKVSGAISNSRNNNGVCLGQLDADHSALGARSAFVQNISPNRTVGSLGAGRGGPANPVCWATETPQGNIAAGRRPALLS